jgi:hypothetical protein
MLLSPRRMGFQKVVKSYSAPAADCLPAAITSGNGVEGSWSEVIADSLVTDDVYAVRMVFINDAHVTGAVHEQLIDLGVDPAGGTSYAAIINNIMIGRPSVLGDNQLYPVEFVFPFYIKAGSAIAMRGIGDSAGETFRPFVELYMQPFSPELMLRGQHSETIGTVSGSDGVSITPGGSAAKGSWVSLGTTSKDLWWWQVGMQVSNATVAGGETLIDLAFGDGTDFTYILKDHIFLADTSESSGAHCYNYGYCPVPAGSDIYARAAATNASPSTGFQVLAYGVGG